MNVFKFQKFEEKKPQYIEKIYKKMSRDFNDNPTGICRQEALEKINWMMDKARNFIDDCVSLEDKKKAAHEISDYLVYIMKKYKIYDLDCYEIFKDTFCRMGIHDYDDILRVAIDKLEV